MPELESHMRKDGKALCGTPDAYIMDTDISDPDWGAVSCERCLLHRSIIVEEASTLGLHGFPDPLVLDGVSMPRLRTIHDSENDIMAVVYRRPNGGEFHVLND